MKTATAKERKRSHTRPLPIGRKKPGRGKAAGRPRRQRSKTRQRLYNDLDALAGSWSKREAAAFDRALAEQRAIDRDLWH